MRRVEVRMKKLTINEIAERAGVSKTTVSFYLNGKINKMSRRPNREYSISLMRPDMSQVLQPGP